MKIFKLGFEKKISKNMQPYGPLNFLLNSHFINNQQRMGRGLRLALNGERRMCIFWDTKESERGRDCYKRNKPWMNKEKSIPLYSLFFVINNLLLQIFFEKLNGSVV